MTNIEIYDCDKKRIDKKIEELKLEWKDAPADIITWLLDNFLSEVDKDVFGD